MSKAPEDMFEVPGSRLRELTDDIRTFTEEVKRLRQGLWDCAVAAGMDTNGNTGPGALVHPDIVDLALGHVRQLASDYNELLMESD
jgi:hypothetical protein